MMAVKREECLFLWRFITRILLWDYVLLWIAFATYNFLDPQIVCPHFASSVLWVTLDFGPFYMCTTTECLSLGAWQDLWMWIGVFLLVLHSLKLHLFSSCCLPVQFFSLGIPHSLLPLPGLCGGCAMMVMSYTYECLGSQDFPYNWTLCDDQRVQITLNTSVGSVDLVCVVILLWDHDLLTPFARVLLCWVGWQVGLPQDIQNWRRFTGDSLIFTSVVLVCVIAV